MFNCPNILLQTAAGLCCKLSCCSAAEVPEPSWPFQGGVGRPSNQCGPLGTPVALGTPGWGVELHNKGGGQRKSAWGRSCSGTKKVGNYSTKRSEVFVSGIKIQVLYLYWKSLEYKFLQKNGDHEDCKKTGSIFGDLGASERGRFLVFFQLLAVLVKCLCSFSGFIVAIICEKLQWFLILLAGKMWEIKERCLNGNWSLLTCFPESSVTDAMLYFINLLTYL